MCFEILPQSGEESALAPTTKPFLTIESYSHKMIVLQAIPELPCRRQSSLLLLLKETILFWGKVPIDTSNYMPIIIICTWVSMASLRHILMGEEMVIIF